MLPLNGVRSPEKRKGRELLTVRDPSVELLLAGLNLDVSTVGEVRQFCKVWLADRNRWDVSRRSVGLFYRGLIRRHEADAVLRRALAALAAGGAE